MKVTGMIFHTETSSSHKQQAAICRVTDRLVALTVKDTEWVAQVVMDKAVMAVLAVTVKVVTVEEFMATDKVVLAVMAKVVMVVDQHTETRYKDIILKVLVIDKTQVMAVMVKVVTEEDQFTAKEVTKVKITSTDMVNLDIKTQVNRAVLAVMTQCTVMDKVVQAVMVKVVMAVDQHTETQSKDITLKVPVIDITQAMAVMVKMVQTTETANKDPVMAKTQVMEDLAVMVKTPAIVDQAATARAVMEAVMGKASIIIDTADTDKALMDKTQHQAATDKRTIIQTKESTTEAHNPLKARHHQQESSANLAITANVQQTASTTAAPPTTNLMTGPTIKPTHQTHHKIQKNKRTTNFSLTSPQPNDSHNKNNRPTNLLLHLNQKQNFPHHKSQRKPNKKTQKNPKLTMKTMTQK